MSSEGPWSNQVQNLVIVGGAGGGVFVYDGSPAAGNLIFSVAATAGKDGFGNQYLGGGAAWYSASSAISVQSGSTITYYTGSLSAGWTATALEITFQSSPLLIDISGSINATSGTETDPTLITTDTWHSVSIGGDWTASGVGVDGFYYTLQTDGNYLLAWDVLNNNANPGTLGTLPFTPSTDVYLQSDWAGTGPTSYNDQFSPGFEVDTSGNITGLGLFVGTLRMYGSAVLPIGL